MTPKKEPGQAEMFKQVRTRKWSEPDAEFTYEPIPPGATKTTDNMELVRSALEKAGAMGLTDEELEKATGLGPNSARPRRIDLVKRNLVYNTNTTRKTVRGFHATVWRIK